MCHKHIHTCHLISLLTLIFNQCKQISNLFWKDNTSHKVLLVHRYMLQGNYSFIWQITKRQNKVYTRHTHIYSLRQTIRYINKEIEMKTHCKQWVWKKNYCLNVQCCFHIYQAKYQMCEAKKMLYTAQTVVFVCKLLGSVVNCNMKTGLIW